MSNAQSSRGKTWTTGSVDHSRPPEQPGVSANPTVLGAQLGAGIPPAAPIPSNGPQAQPGLAPSSLGTAKDVTANARRPTPGHRPQGATGNAAIVPPTNAPGTPMPASGPYAHRPSDALAPGQHVTNTSKLKQPGHESYGIDLSEGMDLRAKVPSVAHLLYGLKVAETPRKLYASEAQRLLAHAVQGCSVCAAFARGMNVAVAGVRAAETRAAAAAATETTPMPVSPPPQLSTTEVERRVARVRRDAMAAVTAGPYENYATWHARATRAACEAELAERRHLGAI